ncbi:hypothetical protein LXL04_036131 [Taraxacum kok-saghyz]
MQLGAYFAFQHLLNDVRESTEDHGHGGLISQRRACVDVFWWSPHFVFPCNPPQIQFNVAGSGCSCGDKAILNLLFGGWKSEDGKLGCGYSSFRGSTCSRVFKRESFQESHESFRIFDKHQISHK